MTVQERTREGKAAKIYPSAVVREGATLGTDVVIGAFCYVDQGAIIGRGTRIQSHTSVWKGVELGEDVFVGPAATFTNARRARARFPRAGDFDRTVVHEGATIGARAVLIAPLVVGRGAMVGAGAVVTGNVPAYAEVVGIPARVIGFVCACGQALARGYSPPHRDTCKRCGRSYVARGNGLEEIALPR